MFLEVKYRSSGRFGLPEEAVSVRKQGRIRLAAMWYMHQHGYPEDTPCRFDVVAILGEHISLIRDAF